MMDTINMRTAARLSECAVSLNYFTMRQVIAEELIANDLNDVQVGNSILPGDGQSKVFGAYLKYRDVWCYISGADAMAFLWELNFWITGIIRMRRASKKVLAGVKTLDEAIADSKIADKWAFKHVSVSIRWFDLWIGLYVDTKNKAIYWCPFPMVAVKFQF